MAKIHKEDFEEDLKRTKHQTYVDLYKIMENIRDKVSPLTIALEKCDTKEDIVNTVVKHMNRLFEDTLDELFEEIEFSICDNTDYISGDDNE